MVQVSCSFHQAKHINFVITVLTYRRKQKAQIHHLPHSNKIPGQYFTDDIGMWFTLAVLFLIDDENCMQSHLPEHPF